MTGFLCKISKISQSLNSSVYIDYFQNFGNSSVNFDYFQRFEISVYTQNWTEMDILFTECQAVDKFSVFVCPFLSNSGHKVDKWTKKFDTDWTNLDWNWTNGQTVDKWTKLDNGGQNRAIPWYTWVSGYFVIIFVQFCPNWTSWWTENVETLDMTAFTRKFVLFLSTRGQTRFTLKKA